MTDHILLLQPFCTKAQFLNGKAKVDLIEKVAGMFVVTTEQCSRVLALALKVISMWDHLFLLTFSPDLVKQLYQRKPQMVEQKVLPLLWHLLGTSFHSGTIHGRGGSVRGATANLCQALYTQMGPSLIDCAASQPANVHKDLNEMLRTKSKHIQYIGREEH